MESTTFHRRVELPGVEMLEVVDSQRAWRCFSSGFELMLPETWQGQVAYRGSQHRLGAGMLFCPGPGDTFEIPRSPAKGSFRVLMIEREVLREGLLEHRLSPELLDFHRVVNAVPRELRAAILTLLGDLRFHSSTLKLQSSMEAFKSSLIGHLARTRRETTRTPGRSAARRMRELIHADSAQPLDLEALARETNLSRFQVVRAFKRAYGMPPYAYQLRLRIARAQHLLSAGHPPAYVASELHFVDQSHLTRHFKRILGVTPTAYARAEGGAKSCE